MKQKDAELLVARIAEQEPSIKAQIRALVNGNQHFCAVELLLVPRGLTTRIKAIEDWPSLHAAWSVLLEDQ